MADVIYNAFKKNIMNGSIDLDTDTIKVMLTTSTYEPSQDNDTYMNQVTNEVTGTGYTAGGATLANEAVTQDNTDNEGVLDADDVTWSTSTITARYAVIYKSSGASTTSPLICCIDFGADKSSSGGNFTISWNAEGIINLG